MEQSLFDSDSEEDADFQPGQNEEVKADEDVKEEAEEAADDEDKSGDEEEEQGEDVDKVNYCSWSNVMQIDLLLTIFFHWT